MTHYSQMTTLLHENAGTRRLSQVFDDFVELSGLSLRNAIGFGPDANGRHQREEQYLRTAGKYSRGQLDRFAETLALVALAMESQPRDVLGELYMHLDLGNKHIGQYYTPYDVALLMASLNIEAVSAQVSERGFARLYEPACGSAAFVVAMAEQMSTRGLDYQRHLHVVAEDISVVAVHMAYIHLSLLHIPAVVHHKNTLSQETFNSWATPAHVLNGWDGRIAHDDLTNGGSVRDCHP